MWIGYHCLLQLAFSPCVLSGVSQNWMVQEVLSETCRVSFPSIGGACQVQVSYHVLLLLGHETLIGEDGKIQKIEIGRQVCDSSISFNLS